jgi:uncharacterized repeat protein (TIGR03803 family)
MSSRPWRDLVVGLLGCLLGLCQTASADPIFTVLHEFGDSTNPSDLVSEKPQALIQGRNGHFYGTTTGGGDTGCGGRGCGTIFIMTPAGAVTTLHVFNGATDGENPHTLIEAADGNFYGATFRGGGSGCGGSGCGTLFKMTPAGAVTVLHAFIGGPTDGASPSSPLLQATDGHFYGMTRYGGSTTQCDTDGNTGCGTVFKLTPDGTVTILHAFVGGPADGDNSSRDGLRFSSSLLQAIDGHFYGTTSGGGGATACGSDGADPACGTVFRMTPVGDVTILHAFRGGPTDGSFPTSLIQRTDGDFYGTTAFGGISYPGFFCPGGCGTIFKMSPDGAFTILHAFSQSSLGIYPHYLLQTSDGNFYGTTPFVNFGGAIRSHGTVFRMTPGGTVTFPHTFAHENAGGVDPHVLIQGADGNLYGTSHDGCRLPGPAFRDCTTGSVFRLTGVNPSTSDDLLVDFGSFGVWALFDNTGQWGQLHTASAKSIVTGDLDGNGIDEAIVDFGSAHGLWVWANNASWYQLHASTANRMVTGDLDGNGQAEVLIDFPGSGIWVRLNNTSWFQLHALSAADMRTADLDGNGQSEAIIDFPTYGLWVWSNNAPWYQLHTVNSRLMTAGDFDGNGQDDLVVDFAGHGLWAYSNNSTWTQVRSINASHLAVGDLDASGKSDLIVDFGNPHGIWVLANGTAWSQIHTLTSANILTADLNGDGKDEVIVDFDTAGLWEYTSNATWFQLHTVSPAVIAVGHASIFNLRVFGAVGDGVTDDGPALQRALNALASAGGGTLVVPAGRYAIASPVSKDFSGLKKPVTIRGVASSTTVNTRGNGEQLSHGLDLTSEFVIKTGQATVALALSNLASLLITDMVFIGTPDASSDARQALFLDGIPDATIRHSEFYGLSSLDEGGAIIHANGSGLSIDQTAFLGSTANSGVRTSVVLVTNWKNISLTESVFIDYGQRPDYWGKLGLSTPFAWIMIADAAPVDSLSPRREATIRNVFMDEGGYHAIASAPDYYDSQAVPADLIYVSDYKVNVSSLGTSAIYIDRGARYTLIERASFELTRNSDAAVDVTNVGDVILDRLACIAAANRIRASATVGTLTVINSTCTDIQSQADTVVLLTAPDDDPVQYVRHEYLAVLGIEPDAEAHFTWTNRLLRCGTDQVCLAQRKHELAGFLGD